MNDFLYIVGIISGTFALLAVLATAAPTAGAGILPEAGEHSAADSTDGAA